ncbi:MAG: hypothetical protein RL748_1020 [Pseudomonadota bacterium]
MLNISEKFTAAGKHSLQAQMALLHQLGDKVFESSQKLLALNLQISKTLLADGKESASQLLQAKHPLDFWTHQSSHLKPTMDHILNYETQLAKLFTDAQTEILSYSFKEAVSLQDGLMNLGSQIRESAVVKAAAPAKAASEAKAESQTEAKTEAKAEPKTSAKPAPQPKLKVVATTSKAAAASAEPAAAKETEKVVKKRSAKDSAKDGAITSAKASPTTSKPVKAVAAAKPAKPAKAAKPVQEAAKAVPEAAPAPLLAPVEASVAAVAAETPAPAASNSVRPPMPRPHLAGEAAPEVKAAI